MADSSFGRRLELYTLKRPGEVLLIHAAIADESDEVVIFRGFSSSLTRPTASDPDIPVLADDATVVSIDRLYSPYIPDEPRYIQQGMSLGDMLQLLAEVGV